MPGLAREIVAGLVDLLYPPRCLLCGALATPFCPTCRVGISPVPAGAPVPAGIAGVRTVGYHEGPLREAVLRLKFHRKVALAAPLGELAAAELRPVLTRWRPAALVPVPIHRFRQWERGYNQAELIAEEVGRRCGLPVVPALRRIRATPPQVGRSHGERAVNLRGAFAVTQSKRVQGARLLLVDDVRTTGATLAECAETLRAAGAAQLYALTVTYEP